jgi:hypothetical protein
MKTVNPLNSVVVEIIRNNNTHYFFLDSGFPFSFSVTGVQFITNTDFNTERNFNLALRSSSPFDLNPLSEMLGVEISGFLGMDFFKLFDNVLIDIKGKRIEFDVHGFEADNETEFVDTMSNFIIKCSMGQDKEQRCLIDTGAFMNASSEKDLTGNKVSKGWVFPSPYGPLNLKFYSNVSLLMNGERIGEYVCSNYDKPGFPFSYVIGSNFISDFQCMFDIKNNKFKLKQSKGEPLLNTRASYTLGFQVVIKDKQIIVSNKLDNCVEGINIGDKIEIPGVNMNDPEVINEIYSKLIFLTSDNETEIILNGEPVIYKPVQLFYDE